MITISRGVLLADTICKEDLISFFKSRAKDSRILLEKTSNKDPLWNEFISFDLANIDNDVDTNTATIYCIPITKTDPNKFPVYDELIGNNDTYMEISALNNISTDRFFNELESLFRDKVIIL